MAKPPLQDFVCPECSRTVKAHNITHRLEKASLERDGDSKGGYLRPKEDVAILPISGYAFLKPVPHKRGSELCIGSKTLYYAGDGSL